MKYTIPILILISIGLFIFMLNFIIQEYNQYKLFKKEFEEYKQVSISQIELNRQNIKIIVGFINNLIQQPKK